MAWQVLKQYGRSFGTGFIVGLPIYITITDLGFCVARVDGISMQPSLNPVAKESDIVLLNRWKARNVFNFKRGDVVSLTSPSDPDVKLIKRIIGLEGDVIKTIGHKKRYISIPKGHCWVEGDHRGKSFDSNRFGPVSLGLVNGVATHIIWPPKRWMRIETNVKHDRMPLRRSFNQCTFNDMLKDTKESTKLKDRSIDTDELQEKGKVDVVAMKKKFLSDDIFLRPGAINLSVEVANHVSVDSGDRVIVDSGDRVIVESGDRASEDGSIENAVPSEKQSMDEVIMKGNSIASRSQNNKEQSKKNSASSDIEDVPATNVVVEQTDINNYTDLVQIENSEESSPAELNSRSGHSGLLAVQER